MESNIWERFFKMLLGDVVKSILLKFGTKMKLSYFKLKLTMKDH
jgi:hypothetical protein